MCGACFCSMGRPLCSRVLCRGFSFLCVVFSLLIAFINGCGGLRWSSCHLFLVWLQVKPCLFFDQGFCVFLAMGTNETFGYTTTLDFRTPLGTKSPSPLMRVVENNLFHNDSRVGRFAPSQGPQIPKINGCLERCKERLVLVIQPKSIVEDVEYFSKHAFICKFMRMRVSLQFLEWWA